MTRRQLEQIRPWADLMNGRIAHATSVGYKPPAGLVRAGYLAHVVDDFYILTPKGAHEIEELRTGSPR